MVRRTKDGNVSGKCPGSVSLAEREIYILSPWLEGGTGEGEVGFGKFILFVGKL